MPHKIDKPESYVSKFLKSPVFLLGFACTGVAVAALLTWAMKFMSPDHLMLGLGVAFCLMCVIIFFTTYLNRIRNVDLLEDKLSTVNKLLGANDLNWIVNQNHIRNIEIESNETWTFAVELTYALQVDSEIYAGTQKNLKRGARYKFFMPDRPRVHKIIADYKRIYDFTPGQVEFILIPHSEFLFHTLFALYNVHTDDIRCIEWLPIRDLDVWIEMDSEHTDKIAGIGEILIRKYANRYTAPTTDPIEVADVNAA